MGGVTRVYRALGGLWGGSCGVMGCNGTGKGPIGSIGPYRGLRGGHVGLWGVMVERGLWGGHVGL